MVGQDRVQGHLPLSFDRCHIVLVALQEINVKASNAA